MCQFAAEKCLSLVAKDAMSREDEHLLPARVLRWMSVCERLFGMVRSLFIIRSLHTEKKSSKRCMPYQFAFEFVGRKFRNS